MAHLSHPDIIILNKSPVLIFFLEKTSSIQSFLLQVHRTGHETKLVTIIETIYMPHPAVITLRVFFSLFEIYGNSAIDIKSLKSGLLSVHYQLQCSLRTWEEVTALRPLRVGLLWPDFVPVTLWHLPAGSVLTEEIKCDCIAFGKSQGSRNNCIITANLYYKCIDKHIAHYQPM